MAFDAAAIAFGEFVLGDHRQEPGRWPPFLVGPFGKVRPKDLDGRQAEFIEQRAERGGVDGRGVSHGDRILPITDQIAVEWGRIAAIRPRGDIDGLIAATAIVHDLILVTRNVKDFEDTDASVINPWETSA